MKTCNRGGLYRLSIFIFLFVLMTFGCLPKSLQYLSDHLTQEECRELVAALHFQTYDVPQQVVAAERKLPENVPCLELLFHWNSEAGEGRGGTHVGVSHRLNQIGRRDLAEWLSRTVFHELSRDLDESLASEPTEETERRPTRVTEPQTKKVPDEAPWLNFDSVLAVLVMLTMAAFSCGCLYLVCLCVGRIRGAAKQKKYDKIHKERAKSEKMKRELLQSGSLAEEVPRDFGAGNFDSEDEDYANLIKALLPLPTVQNLRCNEYFSYVPKAIAVLNEMEYWNRYEILDY